MSIEGHGHFFTIYFPGFVCFVLYKAKISGEFLQDHWSSGFNSSLNFVKNVNCVRMFYTNSHNLLIFKSKHYKDQIINGLEKVGSPSFPL